MKLYMVIHRDGTTLCETDDYLEAIRAQTLHPECVILKFFVLDPRGPL